MTNTDGTITSQVSANVDAGFSIVKGSVPSVGYTNTFGHGLSSAPELIIYKCADIISPWYIFSNYGGSLLGNNNVLRFNISAATSDSLFAITSTTFKTGASSSAHDFIAYCFHSVDGYSKIGSYVGNLSANGPTIVTGFEPAFLMVKRTDLGGNWFVFDNKRSTSNERDDFLHPNSSAAETLNNASYAVDFLSNGFQIKGNGDQINGNNGTHIFMAFAEEVFNPNGVTRNATDPFGDGSELALYKFEDNATNSEDSVTASASNVTYATGYIDKAAVFNGSSSYIRASIPFLNARVTSAVSLWIKYTDTGTYRSVFNDYSNTANFNHNIIVNWPSTGNVRFFSAYGGNTGYKIIESSGLTLNDGNWHHIVSTVDLSTNTLTGYVDGVSVGNVTVSTNAWTGTTQNLQIGRQETGSYFNGSIDQVRIFDRALDAGEVAQLYNE